MEAVAKNFEERRKRSTLSPPGAEWPKKRFLQDDSIGIKSCFQTSGRHIRHNQNSLVRENVKPQKVRYDQFQRRIWGNTNRNFVCVYIIRDKQSSRPRNDQSREKEDSLSKGHKQDCVISLKM